MSRENECLSLPATDSIIAAISQTLATFKVFYDSVANISPAAGTKGQSGCPQFAPGKHLVPFFWIIVNYRYITLHYSDYFGRRLLQFGSDRAAFIEGNLGFRLANNVFTALSLT
jgi:hypothetical protein